MDHFYYPARGKELYFQRKWEPWNNLTIGTPGKIKKIKSYRAGSVHSQNRSNFESPKILFNSTNYSVKNNKDSIEIKKKPNYNNSATVLETDSNKESLDNSKSFARKKSSVISIDELLLLEGDLFTEKQQSQPLITVNHNNVINKPNAIELNGKKITINFSYKQARKKSVEKLKTVTNFRSCKRPISTGKNHKVKKRIETPSPWGVEIVTDNFGNEQKNSRISVHNKFTST